MKWKIIISTTFVLALASIISADSEDCHNVRKNKMSLIFLILLLLLAILYDSSIEMCSLSSKVEQGRDHIEVRVTE